MSRYQSETPPAGETAPPSPAIERLIEARKRDLGGFEVGRVLPAPGRRMVGPFIFFDHIGPADFPAGQGVDVRPHPHIGLATITWLFDGGLHHRDSLGSDLEILPGAMNWMTAGNGIVHSERTGPGMRAAGHHLHGIQSWVALPEEAETCEPSFDHYAPEGMPVIERDGARMVLIAGAAFGESSPARTLSPLFYIQADLQPGAALTLPADLGERAVYVVEGAISVEGGAVGANAMAVLTDGADIEIASEGGARLMLLGGAPVGARHIWWNLVASDPEAIEAAKRDWTAAAEGGLPADGRFAMPPDESEHIPLPED